MSGDKSFLNNGIPHDNLIHCVSRLRVFFGLLFIETYGKGIAYGFLYGFFLDYTSGSAY